MINSFWFYLMEMESRFTTVFTVIGMVLLIIAGVVTIAYFTAIEVDEDKNIVHFFSRVAKRCFIIGLIILFVGLIIPSKEACYKMAVVSYMTPANIEKAGGDASKIVDYIIEQIDKSNNKEEGD